jgi:hypothetical protein
MNRILLITVALFALTIVFLIILLQLFYVPLLQDEYNKCKVGYIDADCVMQTKNDFIGFGLALDLNLID